jgi:hypothetical protein
MRGDNLKAKKQKKPAAKHKPKPAAKPAPKKKAKPAARTQEPERIKKTMTTTTDNTEPQAEHESTNEQQSEFDLESCSKAELIEIIRELGAEVKELRDRELVTERDEATIANTKPWALNPAGFTRGKLPGGKLIVTDRNTGAFFSDVTIDEWYQIPAK